MFSRAVLLLFVILNSSDSQNVSSTENEKFLENPSYLNSEELTNLFKKLETDHPNFVRLHSVGKSVKNRDLWAIEINSNVPNRTLLTPMFKYVANIHGDEALGRQLTIYLAQYLIHNYGKLDRVTKLVDTTDIFLMPSMNPDGYENSEEGNCWSKLRHVGRNNENQVNLNNNFPDLFAPLKEATLLSGRQPETIAMMKWIMSNPFVLSGNFHGGASVASYPFDDLNSTKRCCEESRTPDRSLFRTLALLYADLHPLMKKGTDCEFVNFERGITNGAFWYAVKGSMQDFNYVHSNCFEITFELSCCKFPQAQTLPKEWENNKESILRFVEAVHWGVKGLVTNERNEAILGADIVVIGIKHNVVTTSRGEYWRLLVPGTYKMYATCCNCFSSKWVTVVVEKGKTTVQNFILKLKSR